MEIAMTRRAFLVATSSALAAASLNPTTEQGGSQPLPSGPVYGRVGGRGLDPGAVDRPALGEVATLDGRALVVRYASGQRLAPGKSVWLAPEADGVFSVLYAEV
jgi:hypothetical protein